MSAKVEQSSTYGAVASLASTASGVKVSKFATKSGFLIPKNKLSGSLIPIFRGGKKGTVDASKEENDKQVQRKTKWGPDLTQDTAVKRGRALAYQTRVDQITEELRRRKSETGDNQDFALLSQVPNIKSSEHELKSQELDFLELEKREAIGELLKLNPSYKAPAGYKPLLKEAKVPIPISEYPGHNFVSLIFGPGNETHKRLEKETGAKMRMYGLKADTGLEVEVSATDGSDMSGGYNDLHVHVSADTYEKVDAAVALIELLFMPVSGNPASVSIPSQPSENVNDSGLNQVSSTGMATVVASAQPHIGSRPAAESYMSAGPWFSLTQMPVIPLPGSITSSNILAGPSSNPLQMHPPFNPSMFGPRSSVSGGFTPVPQNHAFVPLGPRPPQVLQHQYMPQPPSLGQIGAPRNMFMPVSQPASIQSNVTPPQVLPNQAPAAVPGPFLRPNMTTMPQSSHVATFPDKPQPPALWSKPSPDNQPSIGSGNMIPEAPAVSGSWASPVASHSAAAAVNNPSNLPFLNSISHSQMGISPVPLSPAAHVPFQVPPSIAPIQPGVQQIPGANSSLNAVPGSTPRPSPKHSGSEGAVSFNPITPPYMAGTRPQQPSTSDFTFQPHRLQNAEFEVSNRPEVLPFHANPNHSMLAPLGSQNPFIQPAHNLRPPPTAHEFARASIGSQMMHHGAQNLDFQGSFSGLPPRHATNAGPLMHPRNFNMAPHSNNAAGFPGRPGGPFQFQQNHPAAARPQGFAPPNQQFNSNVPLNRPSPNSSRLPQVYDPFSPTSVPNNPRPGNNGAMIQKQDSNDPEYEDLMASVGVK